MPSCIKYSEVGPVDFVDRVHLETIIAATINIITFTSFMLFRHLDGKRKCDPGAVVDDLCKRLGMAKGESKKIKVTIETKRVTAGG